MSRIPQAKMWRILEKKLSWILGGKNIMDPWEKISAVFRFWSAVFCFGLAVFRFFLAGFRFFSLFFALFALLLSRNGVVRPFLRPFFPRSIRPSIRPSVRPLVRPFIAPFVCPSVGWSVSSAFALRYTRSDLCRLYGLVSSCYWYSFIHFSRVYRGSI